MNRYVPLVLLCAAGVAQADDKKVLLEVYTGAWCGYCPDGMVFADTLQAQWSDRLVVVYVHQGDQMAFAPSPIEEMAPSGYPMGSIDRGAVESRGDWSARVAERMATAPGASLHLLQRYATGTRNLEVEATATFAQVATGATQLRLHLVEDGVTGSGTGWDQENNYNFDTGFHPYGGRGDPILGFEHPRVLRATPVGLSDDGAIAANAATGQVESERWEFTLPAGWDPERMSAVAFLIDKDVPVGIRRVWQVEEIEVGAEAAYDLLGTTGTVVDAVLDFGSLAERESDEATITVMSTGTRPLVLGALEALTDPAFSVVSEDCAEASHDPSSDCTITVRFDPEAVGAASDDLRIPYEAVDGGVLSVHLAGVATFDGAFTVAGAGAEPEVDFGDVRVGGVGTATVTVNSAGPGTLWLGARDAVAAPFSVTSDTCSGAAHAMTATCTAGVRFAPTAAGDATGTLRIPFEPASAGAVTVALKGRGNLAPQAIDDAYTVVAGETLEVAAPGVLANDVDAESDTIISFVDEGTEGLGMAITGAFSLETTAADAGNTITFTYAAEDAHGAGLRATVRVDVTAPDDGDEDDDEDPRQCGCGGTGEPVGAGAGVALLGLLVRRARRGAIGETRCGKITAGRGKEPVRSA